MGFYGNITNTARTQFQFDRTYPNRYTMDQNTLEDEVYAGRFVLIEYDTVGFDGLKRAWKINGNFYNQDNEDINLLLTKGNTEKGTIIYTADTDDFRVNPYNYSNCIFYECISDFEEGSNEPAIFSDVANGDNVPPYTVNYNIDINRYQAGRGYDSTVWQKVYTEGNEKYVMIAELNTVVPRFDVVAEPPTMNPIVPHFDTDSTDVYYKLHWQAPWGFRIGATDADKSDIKTSWTTTTYDPATGENNVSAPIEKDAAIYFNKKAFEPYPDEDGNWTTHVEGENYIKVIPVSSGEVNYTDHRPGNTMVAADDIQEMSINLPAIGNMMSDAWDIIHGPNRNDARTDENSSLQGRLDSFKYINSNQIPVKRVEDGTLIGSMINNAIAYNNWEEKPEEILSDTTEPNFDRDDAWIKTEINTTNLRGGTQGGEDIDQSSNSGISIHHTFHATADSKTTLDKNTGNITQTETYKEQYIPEVTEVIGEGDDAITTSIKATNIDTGTDDTIKLYTPYVDAKGHVVGENIEIITLPYSYRTYTTIGINEENSSDIYTEIIEADNGADTSTASADETSTIADQTQDTLEINPGNKWIQTKFENDVLTIAHEIHAISTKSNGTSNINTEIDAVDENNINIPDFEYDVAGHIIEKHDHYYTLPFGFKTITTNGRGHDGSENTTGTPVITPVVADTTQDNLAIDSGDKWIRIDTDTSLDSLTIRHDILKTSSSTSEQSLSSESAGATFEVPTYQFDEAGHYSSHDTKTITMPFGYGKIKGDGDTSTAATATFDTVTFGSDEWLTATVSKDTVTYSHDYPNKTNDTTSNFDVNGNGDTIILETLARDATGHVTKVNQNTVTLPYGYKTFTGDRGTTSAKNTQDTIAVVGDNWISTTVSDDKIIYTHIGPVNGTVTNVSSQTPTFGATFTIDDHHFDEKGHKFSSSSHTVQIPSPSLISGVGNVVTGLSLEPAKGAFTENKTNLGAIQLGTYESGDSADDLNANITLQQALSRLQNKITNEAINRQNAIEALDVTDTAIDGQYVSAVSETDGKITISRANLPVYTLATGSTNGTVSFNDNDIKIKGLGSAAYTNSENYATKQQGEKADNALQLDTKFKENTIEELLDLIIALNKTVEELKAKINEYHPITSEEEEEIPGNV